MGHAFHPPLTFISCLTLKITMICSLLGCLKLSNYSHPRRSLTFALLHTQAGGRGHRFSLSTQ
ncbi:uncharacterized protein BO95DRAFT_84121 [Aspergillus brunneoviolaceus CBS 621.78]|uniref:Uncharacterized protein n=1 Tax=Aspergillus brunneoviolaceus CBS 621.78 TaxID=1450534 RepID=A0ACD1GDW3_9EURO|nr:hypothetical protein BO95DRAFT_84121 [Aspergillus brunneoviolaceus CBS 621.78]RAH47402.1 hypothetical protein BO95DRAFT_84121 [Aspergillus brunneoviolaceus CBS 621.78]